MCVRFELQKIKSDHVESRWQKLRVEEFTSTALEADAVQNNEGGGQLRNPLKPFSIILQRCSKVCRIATTMQRHGCTPDCCSLSSLHEIERCHQSLQVQWDHFCNAKSWPLWKPTSQGSPHLQTQLQNGSRLTFFWPFSYIPLSSFTFPGAPNRIFLQFLPWLPCHFYLVFIEQQPPVACPRA